MDDKHVANDTLFPHPFALQYVREMKPEDRKRLLKDAVRILWFTLPPAGHDAAEVVRKLHDLVETAKFWAEVYTVVRDAYGRGLCLRDVWAKMDKETSDGET